SSHPLGYWQPRRFRPELEALEQRCLPAVYKVLNINDSGPDSLREAITKANMVTPGVNDTIQFAIPGAGVHTITLMSQLPDLSDPAGLTIDGHSQPGSSVNTLTQGDNAILQIELNGNNAVLVGLNITAANNTVQGLVVNRFKEDGIRLTGPNAFFNAIKGNF